MATNWLRRITKGMAGLVVMLASVTYVHAQNACDARSLNGGFGFQVTGVNTALGGVRFAISGRFESDGNGQFTGAGTESVEGGVGRVTFVGTYTVENDCTGSAEFVFPNGIRAHLDFVLVDNGNEAMIIDSDFGTVETGTAKKQFPRPR